MSTAADMFAQSLVHMSEGHAQRRQAEARNREAQSVIAEWQSALHQAQQDNAANIAEKMALRKELERYCPNHPLLRNRMLVERLQNLGAQAFASNVLHGRSAQEGFVAAREAGEGFQID